MEQKIQTGKRCNLGLTQKMPDQTGRHDRVRAMDAGEKSWSLAEPDEQEGLWNAGRVHGKWKMKLK